MRENSTRLESIVGAGVDFAAALRLRATEMTERQGGGEPALPFLRAKCMRPEVPMRWARSIITQTEPAETAAEKISTNSPTGEVRISPKDMVWVLRVDSRHRFFPRVGVRFSGRRRRFPTRVAQGKVL